MSFIVVKFLDWIRKNFEIFAIDSYINTLLILYNLILPIHYFYSIQVLGTLFGVKTLFKPLPNKKY